MKNKNHPRGKRDICFANIASPGGDFIFRKKGREETGRGKNLFLKMYFSILNKNPKRNRKGCILPRLMIKYHIETVTSLVRMYGM